MVRLCMRSKCDRPAQVRLTYDTLRCQVWLDPLPEQTGMVHEICEFHAKRITLPMGWTLSDRRSTTPSLFDFAVVNACPPIPTVGRSVERERSAARTQAAAPARDGRRAVRTVRGRHPSLSASEFFASTAPIRTAEPVVEPPQLNDDAVTVDLATRDIPGLADGSMSVIAYGNRAIERVVLLTDSASETERRRRGA